MDSCRFYAIPVQSPPQLTGFVVTGDEENQYSALDQSQLSGAGGSGVTQERLPVLKIHSGRLACWYRSLTIRAIIWEMIYSSVTQICCELWLSLCWCCRRHKSKKEKENRKRKLTDNGRLERSEPFTGRKKERFSNRWLPSFSTIHDDEWSETLKGRRQQKEAFTGACCASSALCQCSRRIMTGGHSWSVSDEKVSF